MKDLNFRLVTRKHTEPGVSFADYSMEQARKVRAFHESFPMYAPPLWPGCRKLPGCWASGISA